MVLILIFAEVLGLYGYVYHAVYHFQTSEPNWFHSQINRCFDYEREGISEQ
jgi:hypothetical protein